MDAEGTLLMRVARHIPHLRLRSTLRADRHNDLCTRPHEPIRAIPLKKAPPVVSESGETRGAFLCGPPPADIWYRKNVKKNYEIFVHIRKPPPLVSVLGETRGAFLRGFSAYPDFSSK